MKKQRNQIILFTLLLLVLLIINSARTPPSPPTFVYGNLSAADVAEIKGAVRQNIRSRLFPNFSWANIKNLTWAVKNYTGHHLQAVAEQPNGGVEVNVRYSAAGKWPHVETYSLRKGPKGWQITGTQLLVN